MYAGDDAMHATINNPHPMAGPVTTSTERNFALAAHLLLLAGQVVPVVPSLILWLVKRDESAFIDDHGKESVNFQISLLIYVIIGMILTPACGIGMVLLAGVYVLAIVTMIMGSIAASNGRYYRYPMCIRMIP
ncbi:MAG: DUF4870 domain-containing protein [Phycisphaerales bacterium]|nr:DUF4870 domain-containing protein [Phycisphaerales bacterium]